MSGDEMNSPVSGESSQLLAGLRISDFGAGKVSRTARNEQASRVERRESADVEADLGDARRGKRADQSPGGGEDSHVRCGSEEAGEEVAEWSGRGMEDVLAVVENEKQTKGSEVLEEGVVVGHQNSQMASDLDARRFGRRSVA